MIKPLISVISPVYNAEKIIDTLVERIIDEVSKITSDFEVVLVEDDSPDDSWGKIVENCRKDTRVKGIKLSRNFGQHYAITAGLEAALGEYTVVIDCDLQDNPKYIPEMYNKALEGYDIIYTSKKERKHSWFKNASARVFSIVFNYLAENKYTSSSIGAYSLLNRKVVDAFSQIKDTHRHYLLVLSLLGFKSVSIEITHEKRFEGNSSYNLSRLIKHAINGITSQSDKLLRLSISLGFLLCIIATVWAIVIVFFYFKRGAQPGYTSIMVFLLLSTGLILMSIGIAGIYIGKIFEQVKNRPLYFIDKKINF